MARSVPPRRSLARPGAACVAAAALALSMAAPASATTITVDAGGNDYYQGTVDGGTVFVGNIVVERADTFAAVGLGRTNGQGSADTVPDDGVDHQVLAEVYPQAFGNGCEFRYSTDGFQTETVVAMPYDSPAGNNDKFLGVLPGQVFGADTTVELYVRCVGPTAGGNDFEAFVPGGAVNFFYEVDHTGLVCVDADGDGWGDPGDPSCPGGADADCDDTDASIHPGAAEPCDGVDNDCDGSIDEDPGYDQDGDGSTTCGGDCDDGNADVYPGHPEVCDGVDNDCDGTADPADAQGCATYFRDADDDGYGVNADTACLCAAADPYDAAQGGDCDDTDAARFPGNAEVCDGVDNDCDGALPGGEADVDGDGTPVCAGDCDDADATVHPLAPELCDQLDNDCDGLVDEETGDDLDGDGYNACTGDCFEGDPAVYPGAPEQCNGEDDSCDGALPADELDADADGWMGCQGDCDDADATANLDDGDGDGWHTCDTPPDCDDTAADISPGSVEVCDDGVDNDCDGDVDGDDGDCGGDDDDDDDATDDDDTTDDDDATDDDDTGDDDTGDDDTGDDDTGDDDAGDDDATPPGDDDTTGDAPPDCACGLGGAGPTPWVALFAVAGLALWCRRAGRSR